MVTYLLCCVFKTADLAVTEHESEIVEHCIQILLGHMLSNVLLRLGSTQKLVTWNHTSCTACLPARRSHCVYKPLLSASGLFWRHKQGPDS